MTADPGLPTTTRERRHEGRLRHSRVASIDRISPSLARIRLDGDLADYRDNGSDQHVAVYVLPDDAEVPDGASGDWFHEHWLEVLPQLRRYTIRRHDPLAAAVDMDFVLHGDGGPASRLAGRAAVGDRVVWWGPTAAYDPDPDAAWHLLVGDETALPAIGAILEELPAGATARAVVEVPDAADRQDDIAAVADVDVTWVTRGDRAHGAGLLEATRALALPPGRGRVWAAGERAVMREVRAHLRTAGVDRADTNVTAYWEHGVAQDAKAERRDREQAAEMHRLRAAGQQVGAHSPDDEDDDEHEHDHDGHDHDHDHDHDDD